LKTDRKGKLLPKSGKTQARQVSVKEMRGRQITRKKKNVKLTVNRIACQMRQRGTHDFKVFGR
jgi:hypothetical protein